MVMCSLTLVTSSTDDNFDFNRLCEVWNKKYSYVLSCCKYHYYLNVYCFIFNMDVDSLSRTLVKSYKHVVGAVIYVITNICKH